MENTPKALIRKYIHQDCTPAELEEIKRLLLLPETKRLFDEVLSENWTELEPEQDIEQTHLNQQLKRFYEKLETEATEKRTVTTVAETQVRRLQFKRYLSYAAVFALFSIGLGAYYALQIKKTPSRELMVAMHETINPNGQRARIVLPDSSVVFLGAGSKLKYPERFARNTREITLSGEAFFQVSKNPHKPFIIHTGAVQTQVLGTSFKIEAFDQRLLTVAVATGKVRVDRLAAGKRESLAVLTPGQQVSYDGQQAVQGTVNVAEVQSWKDARLTFHQRKLIDITTELERWYNVKFRYKQALKSREEISVVLQADIPLNKIMKVLSATGHFQYQIED